MCWFDKGLTCFLYCKVIMGSFITQSSDTSRVRERCLRFVPGGARQMVRREGTGARQEQWSRAALLIMIINTDIYWDNT